MPPDDESGGPREAQLGVRIGEVERVSPCSRFELDEAGLWAGGGVVRGSRKSGWRSVKGGR